MISIALAKSCGIRWRRAMTRGFLRLLSLFYAIGVFSSTVSCRCVALVTSLSSHKPRFSAKRQVSLAAPDEVLG